MDIFYDYRINDFIIKVFNYYNGRINIVNNAILNINWREPRDSFTLGTYNMPCVITIYPLCIMDKYKSDNARNIIIIDTIIHELYHADQIIDHRLNDSDDNYHDMMEKECYSQTAIYLLTHKQELFDVFGIEVHNGVVEYYNSGVSSLMIYKRKCYNDHIFSCIDYLYDFDNNMRIRLYYAIIDNINNNRLIVLTINDETIYINGANGLLPIEIFNTFIFKYVCADNKDVILNSYINNEQGLSINMRIEARNIMCYLREE